MLEGDEPDKIEMCLTCPARRMKGVDSKKVDSKKVTVWDIALDAAIGFVCLCIVTLIATAIYAFSCLGNV